MHVEYSSFIGHDGGINRFKNGRNIPKIINVLYTLLKEGNSRELQENGDMIVKIRKIVHKLYLNYLWDVQDGHR